MHKPRKGTTAWAAALAVAMVGLSAPATGAAEGRGADDAGSRPDGLRTVTLPTGDRVHLNKTGTVTGVAPAPGRESVPMRVVSTPASTYVIPRDAAPRIEAGTLGHAGFNVSDNSRAQQPGSTTTTQDGREARDDPESEWHDLTIVHTGRDGAPADDYWTVLLGIGESAEEEPRFPHDGSGTVTLRVPTGRYVLTSSFYTGDDEDVITRPRLVVNDDITVRLDARVAKPVEITVPDQRADEASAAVGLTITADGESTGTATFLDDLAGVRIGHAGPPVEDAELQQEVQSRWRGPDREYHVGYRIPGSTLATGFTRHVTEDELAVVTANLGTSVPGKRGAVSAIPMLGTFVVGFGFTDDLPQTRAIALAGSAGVRWELEFEQRNAQTDDTEARYRLEPVDYVAGERHRVVANVGVFGPSVDAGSGIFRSGNRIYPMLSVLADGAGHAGESVHDRAVIRLYRNGKLIGTRDDANFPEPFDVPAEHGRYRLTMTVTRSGVASVSTDVSAQWTFTSAEAESWTPLPVSAVRFSPRLSLDSTARAAALARIPVTVQGAAAEGNLASLTVSVSYDDGLTWQPAPMRAGKILVRHPERGAGLSLRAQARDRQGNTLRQEIHNAYLGA